MGWFDFLKKKKEINGIREINISEADVLVEKELSKEEDKIKDVKKEVSEKISEFVSNIREKIKVLDLIDLKEKKEPERIKEIVLHNLKEYINELDRLVSSLEKIDEVKINSYFKEINSIIDGFSKSSSKKLQKATILIGKEIAQTEAIVKAFYKEINRVVQENEKTISKMEDIEKLHDLKESFVRAKETQNDANKIFLNLEEEKKKVMDKRNEKEKEINLFKESEEFKKWIEKKEEIKNEMKELNRDINVLKEKIDLKSLLKKFHEIERIRILIKDYRDNFLKGLESDEKLELAEMLKEGGSELKRIAEKRLELKKKSESYSVNEKNESLREGLEKIDYEINHLDKKIEEEKRKLMKFNEKVNILQKDIIGMTEKVLDVKIK